MGVSWNEDCQTANACKCSALPFVVVLSSGTQRALLLGDVAHCPAQLVENEWAALFDVDPAMALQTRTALARELEGGDALAAGTHFPGMRFGRLMAAEGKRRWVVD